MSSVIVPVSFSKRKAPFVFYIDFITDKLNDDKEYITRSVGFVVTDSIFSTDQLTEEMPGFRSQLEMHKQYGTYLWSCSPTSNVDGIGFMSSNINEEHIDTVMQSWYEYFKPFGNLSSIVEFVNDDENDTSDIFDLLSENI